MIVRRIDIGEIPELGPLMLALYERWDDIDPVDKIDRDWFCSQKQYKYLKKIIEDKNKRLLVADENGIVGYLLAEIEERKPFLKKAGYIAETYTIPKYRSKGIATALFQGAMDWFTEKKIKWIMVSMHSLDEEAIKFWGGRGFEEFNRYYKMEIQQFLQLNDPRVY